MRGAVLESIFEGARTGAGRLAVVTDGVEITYGQFAHLIAAAARYLGGQAVAPGGVTVISTPSLFDAWILGLALRSIGRDTLTVRAPDDIAGLGLPDVRAIVAPASARIAEIGAAVGAPVISPPPEAFAEAATPPDLSGPRGGHILLTSGTTGIYKKVLIDPGSEAKNAPRRAALFGMAADTILNLFDFGGWTSAGHNIANCAWAAGGAVVMELRAAHLSMRGDLTHAVATPFMLDRVLGASGLKRNDGLRVIVISGALSQALLEKTRARLTHQVFTNLGSTETGPFSMTRIETADDLRWHRLVPPPEAQVVDEDDRALPAGELGRIRVRLNDNVTGYRDDPVATAAFFKDGWFYPGDFGVMREDGRLGLFGRVTDVINIDGNKHPAAPIEAALQDALGIEGVCVFSAQNEGALEEVHVAIEAEAPVEPKRLAAALNAALHGFAHAHIHYLASLPRTSTGKVARAELKQMLSRTGA